jgi:AraC family transcriptional regulator
VNTDHAANTIGALAHAEPLGLVGEPLPLAALWSHMPLEVEVRGLELHAIALHLGGCTLVEKWRDGRCVGHRARVGSVSLVPAFTRTAWVLGGPMQVAHFYIDPAELERAAESSDVPRIQLRDFYAERDPWLAALICDVLARGARIEPLERDEFVSRVARHLMHHYRVDARPSAAAAPLAQPLALTNATLRRVFAHIDAVLEPGLEVNRCDSLRLADLATIARLSPDHFLRAFKASVGQTPHQYVLAQRIDRAQHLLRSSRRPVADIWRITGFSTASHFAAAFRRRVGCTPTEWRQAQAGR